MSEERDYVCSLTPENEKKATEELGEDPRERLGAVQTLREWTLQQKHLKCPTDTIWLLRFLRPSKFSQLKAREKITRYLTMKVLVPAWLEKVDFAKPSIQAIHKTGTAVILPGLMPDGSRVIYHRPGILDTKTKAYDVHSLACLQFAQMAILSSDENIQVNGIRMFMDMSDFSMANQNFYGIDNSKKFIKLIQSTFPMRMKGLHFYNHGPVMEAFLTLIKPFMSGKLKGRLFMHGSNLEGLYKMIPKRILPQEYVPDGEEALSAGPLADIVAAEMKMLMSPSVRNKMLADSAPEYKIDLAMAPRMDSIPQESFRKLNIDD